MATYRSRLRETRSRSCSLGRCPLGQVLHVDVDEADLVILDGAVRLAGLLGGRQPVEALGLEDAVDGVPVQVR